MRQQDDRYKYKNGQNSKYGFPSNVNPSQVVGTILSEGWRTESNSWNSTDSLGGSGDGNGLTLDIPSSSDGRKVGDLFNSKFDMSTEWGRKKAMWKKVEGKVKNIPNKEAWKKIWVDALDKHVVFNDRLTRAGFPVAPTQFTSKWINIAKSGERFTDHTMKLSAEAQMMGRLGGKWTIDDDEMYFYHTYVNPQDSGFPLWLFMGVVSTVVLLSGAAFGIDSWLAQQ